MYFSQLDELLAVMRDPAGEEHSSGGPAGRHARDHHTRVRDVAQRRRILDRRADTAHGKPASVAAIAASTQATSRPRTLTSLAGFWPGWRGFSPGWP